MERPIGLLATLTALLTLTACGHLKPAAPPISQEKGTAYGQIMPVAKVFLFCTSPAQWPELLSTADDPAIAYRGLRRVANGAVSIGIKDPRGHWMRGAECGGRLMVSGSPGQPHSLEIVNETDRSIDITLTQSSTALTGPTPLRLAPHARKNVPFPWAIITGREALFRYDLAAQPGVLCATVYPVTDSGKPWTTERLAPLPTGGPQRKYVPLALPFEYR